MIKKILCCLLIAGCIGPAAASTAAGRTTTMTVIGQGMTSRPPDFADIRASIVTNDLDSAKATSENNSEFDALKSALNPLHAEIQTSYYSVGFNAPPDPKGPARPLGFAPRYGYIVSRQIQIKVSDVPSVSAVIRAVIDIGATNIGGNYGLNDQRSAYADALKTAMLDARTQADAIAIAAHVRIVRVRSIQSGYYGGPGPVTAMPLPTAPPMSPNNAPTNLQPGPVQVRASLTVVYEVATEGRFPR